MHAGGHIERAGRLVTEQHRRPLGDGARDRDALLLAAGELCREVMRPLAEAHQLQCFLRRHGIRRDLRHQLDVLLAP